MSSDSLQYDPHIIISGGAPGVGDALKRRMVERGVPAREVRVGGHDREVPSLGTSPSLSDRAEQVSRQAEAELEIARRTAAYEASARRLVNLTYAEAEAQYYQGRINQFEFDAFQAAWRRGGHHLGAGVAAGAERPQEPAVERLVQAIFSCLKETHSKGGAGSTPPPPPAAPALEPPRRLPGAEAPPDPEVVVAVATGSSPIPPEVLFPKRTLAPRRRMDGPAR